MTGGPRTSQVFLAAFIASLIGGGLGAGFAVSYLASENERATAQASAAAEARRRAIEEEAKRVDEERRRLEEALRRTEDERRRLESEARRKAEEDAKRRTEESRRIEEERRRAEEEARRRAEEARRQNPGAPVGISCDYAAPALKGAFTHETDCYYLQRTMRLALEQSTDGGPASTWTNVRTGSSGTVKVLDTEKRADGAMCRRFEQAVIVEGKATTATGTACLRSGAWRIEA
jgi:hypothetical protein